MSPEFIEIPKKRRPETYRPAIHLRFRAPPIFKAKLKQLAFKRNTTVSKILRSYVRYCLEKKEDLPLDLPLEKESYYVGWMKN